MRNAVTFLLASIGACLCLCAVAIIAFSTVADAARGTLRTPMTITDPPGSVVIVRGCKREDDCSQDYRRNRRGRGVWVIKRAAH